jgi:hypothetical protein
MLVISDPEKIRDALGSAVRTSLDTREKRGGPALTFGPAEPPLFRGNPLLSYCKR